MEFSKIFSMLKQFIRGKMGLISFLLALFGFLLVWLLDISLSGIVQDKAVHLYNTYIVPFLMNRQVPVWVLILLLPILLIITFGIGIIMGRRNRLPQPQQDSLTDIVLDPATSDGNLFQDLIDEIEENPTGLPHGKLWNGVIQVGKKEMSEQEFAAQVVTMLNKEEINEKIAQKFLERFGFTFKHIGNEYSYERKSSERRLP